MSKHHPSKFLRLALLGDAAASGATGLMMAVGAGLMSNLMGLPTGLLRGAGLVLLPYAAVIAYIARRDRLAAAAVRTIIAVNAAWAAASVLLLAGASVNPTALGFAFVVFQAAVVAGFAVVQYIGQRRAAAEPLTATA